MKHDESTRPPGQRIMIIGSGGAGKSTLARQLGEALGLPVIHLDAEYWQPGWVETPKEEWKQKVATLVEGERWIIDGNYLGTLALRLLAADTVIFLNYPWPLCLWRILKRRILYHGRTRPDMNPGCAEKIDWEFLKWVCYDYPCHVRRQTLHLITEHGAGKTILLHSLPRETERLLAQLRKE